MLSTSTVTSHILHTKYQIPVNFDYRQNNGKLAIHLCHKVALDKYIALFSQIKLTLSAIDLPACALRYLASYLNISPKSKLIYCKNNSLFWVSSDDEMPHYGTCSYQNQQEQKKLIYQLIEKYHWSKEQCYFAGDNAIYFNHLMPLWPDFSHCLFQFTAKESSLSLIALGLALRPWETSCIK
ncbi:hypothetical protein AB8849_00165 [Proteus vulgaris]